MDKKLLTKIFKDNLLTSLEHIAHIYRHLFEILGDDQLESSLEYLYLQYTEEKGLPKDEQYWFYSFHKSIRQTDFFMGCQKTINKSSISEDEKIELAKMRKDINAEWTKVKKHYLAVNPEMTVWKYYAEAYPIEYVKYRALRDKEQQTETHDINGHLDGMLWNLIHADKDDVLKLTMLRSFKEHDLELEMEEENPKKS